MAATWAQVTMAASPLNMPACCLETTSAWRSNQIKALRQHYFPWQAWSCYIKLVLYFTFLVLYFFILSYISTLCTVLETNIVTCYLNIVRTKLTTLFIERLGSSSYHFHIVLWYHRWWIVHKDIMKRSWILYSYPLKSSWI